MSARASLDVSGLPRHAFGQRAPLWWGCLLLVAIEGTMMGLLLVSYLYLRGNYELWPPSGYGGTVLRLAVAQALLLAASFPPMALGIRAAKREALWPTRLWLLLVTLLGLAMLALRAAEIAHLPFRWDSHAYGSVFWMILGLHTTHVLAGVVENAVILTLLFFGPVEKKHFGDVEASALLWYFVVLEWVPMFALLYFEPIFLAR
jgi:cytochrome c oxidase subunit 3